jgi:4-hydroxy-3-methylbut-2-enyl diphosphate reductase
MGVRRAVDMALDLERDSLPRPIVTYGPLIHNPQTLELLESRGIRRVETLDEIKGGTVVVRAHGISPGERLVLEQKGVRVIDATCPRVRRVQAVIGKHAKQGHFCFIVGDEEHPEVRGLIGFASAGGAAIASPSEKGLIESVSPEREVCVVAQTTQEHRTFGEVTAILEERFTKIHLYNTICDSTKKRQNEASNLARVSDLVVVVGGRGSGNTQRLVKIAESQGTHALHVETAEELSAEEIAGLHSVGVTAGASTPNWQIQRVIHRIKEIGRSRAAGPLRVVRRLVDIAVMTYFWAAIGGGGLTAACLILQGREVTWLPLAVAMLFVFSMHLLNRLLEGAGAVRFNTPEIVAFYARHRVLLLALGMVSAAAALILSRGLGMHGFALLGAMLVGGLFYTLPVVVPARLSLGRWRSLKEIPGSKTPLVAVGWALAAAVVPVLGDGPPESLRGLVGTAAAFLFAGGMVFWRTCLSDLVDIQGDRMVGRETIPILIGVKRSGKLLMRLLVFLSLLLIVSSGLGWTTPAGYLLVVDCLLFGLFFMIYERRHLVDRLSFDGLLDANLLLAGVLCVLWSLS